MLMAETLCGNRVVIQLAKVVSCHSERSARNLSDVTIRSAILTEPLPVTSGLKFKRSSNRRNLNRRAISSSDAKAWVKSHRRRWKTCRSSNRQLTLPILRPLVGMDKQEIIDQARRIGTFDISAIPDQDCYQLFVPKHPATKARFDEVNDSRRISCDSSPLNLSDPYISKSSLTLELVREFSWRPVYLRSPSSIDEQHYLLLKNPQLLNLVFDRPHKDALNTGGFICREFLSRTSLRRNRSSDRWSIWL